MAEAVVAGNQFDIGIALQSAKGVTVADANVQYRFPVTGGGLDLSKVVNVIDETAQGRVRNTSYVGAVNVDGAPSLAARPNILALLLYGVMGAKAVTGSADPWTHTLTLAAAQPYFTMWKRLGPEASGGAYEKYRDCKIVALSLASSAEGILIATPTIMGLRAFSGTAAATAVTIEAGSVVFAHHHGEGAMLIEAAAVNSINSFTLNIGGNALRVRGTSLYGSDIAEQMRDITITTTQLIDWALRNRILYGSASPTLGTEPSAAVLELGAPGVDYKFTIPGSPERSVKFTATRAQVSMDPVDPNTGGEPLMMNLTYNIFQPSDGSSAITAVVKNSIAAYAAAP